MDQELELVREQLRLNAVTKRKDAVKRLDTLLDSPDFQLLLERRTVKLWPEDKIPGPLHAPGSHAG